MEEELFPEKDVTLLNENESSYYLSKSGPLAKTNPNYEERPEQLQLLKAVCTAFNENKIGVFEAGTGVGKSFAYLIPSIIWAEQNHQRIVISTGTINLQHQLIEKDIPAALKLTGSSIKSLMIKGRQNYLCRRRFADTLDEKDLFTENADFLDKIKEWSDITKTGSRSELDFVPQEALWQKINSESDACMGKRCPFADSCFVMKLKKEASEAHILVVNHHLMFADIDARMNGAGYDDPAVLPPYKRIVFDEAHGIEEAATSFFSASFSRFYITKQINLLYHQKKRSLSGLLFTVEAISSADSTIEEITDTITFIKNTVAKIDELGLRLLSNSFSLRLTEDNNQYFSEIFAAFNELRTYIAEFSGFARKMFEGVDKDDEDMPAVWEAKQIVKRIEEIGVFCQKEVEWQQHKDTIFWLEKRRLSTGDFFVNFIQTPLEIASMMNAGVYEPMESVVCTSATLKTGNSFNYWNAHSGINFVSKDRIISRTFGSPFPYEKNLFLAIPTDAPLPQAFQYQQWLENAVTELIKAADGKTLVLFTSYDSLSYTCEYARNRLTHTGIKILKQGEEDRFRLLEKFKDDKRSVLFATDSFWEGVDVPGDSLSQVIITKLPFQVPSDPVFAARSENLEKKGISSFMELSIPDAVMHFRQGFGRLMRRATDRGTVIVLDSRIIKKNYGRIFLESIPKSIQYFEPLSTVLRRIEDFFDTKDPELFD